MEEQFDVLDENGLHTDQVAPRDVCHQKGLYHKAVVLLIKNSNNEILLQRRSSHKKLWPNMWDISAGGHVLAGEYGYEAVIREAEEELGIDDIRKEDILFLESCMSHVKKGDIIDNMLNEYYIISKDIDINTLKLQTEEVSEVKWFKIEEICKMINDGYKEITSKTGIWNTLITFMNKIR